MRVFITCKGNILVRAWVVISHSRARGQLGHIYGEESVEHVATFMLSKYIVGLRFSQVT
jgi:hypothetical protein